MTRRTRGTKHDARSRVASAERCADASAGNRIVTVIPRSERGREQHGPVRIHQEGSRLDEHEADSGNASATGTAGHWHG